MHRLLIFEQRPAVQLHILVDLQRTIASIWRKHQLLALRGVEAALFVARRDAGFLRNDPDLVQPQTIRFARVVLGVANAGPGAHNLEFTGRNLFFIAHTVLVFYGAFQYIGQNFHVFMRMRAETLACVDHIVVNHTQRREPHKVRIVIIGKRKGMPGVKPAMIRMTAVVCFA